MYFSLLPLLVASAGFGSLSFVTFSGVLSLFLLSKTEKINKNWTQFLNILFFCRETMKDFIRHLQKSQEPIENSLYTCFKCGSDNIFSIEKQVRSADEGTSVFNECRDCHNKWRDG